MFGEKTSRPVREARFCHGLLAFGLLALVMFVCVVVLGTQPQIPMVVGCTIAGAVAMYLGHSWEDVLDAMMKGILDALEAVLVLMCIGMLVGAWISSGTVPTLIFYGLKVISPELFLPICFLMTLAVGIVMGSWGAAGTIGIAFIGIAAALDIPLGMAAGSIIAGAYVSEIASPLTDGPILCAAISECGIFDLCKRFVPYVLAVCILCAGAYFVLGMGLDIESTAAADSSTAALLGALNDSYNIGPLTLIPLAVMIGCIVMQVPAIPSFLLAIALGVVEAVLLQGADPSYVVEALNTGAIATTGVAKLDNLLSTGGIGEMLPTISIVILVMAYAGIMNHTGLLASLVDPIISRLRSFRRIVPVSVISGTVFNMLLPDQYPAITMSATMYKGEYHRQGVANAVWANIVNSSAGITSVLVPWNTCSIYMVTILGVSCLEYLPWAFFCWGYPLVILILGVLFGKQLGWTKKDVQSQTVSSKQGCSLGDDATLDEAVS